MVIVDEAERRTWVADAVFAAGLAAFYKMKLVRRDVWEDGEGSLWCTEIRRHHLGETQKLTYQLDTRGNTH